MSEQLTSVGLEEFLTFLKEYPRRYKVEASTIYEPPIFHAHDASLPSKGEPGSSEYFFDTEIARWKEHRNYRRVAAYDCWIRK